MAARRSSISLPPTVDSTDSPFAFLHTQLRRAAHIFNPDASGRLTNNLIALGWLSADATRDTQP